MKKNKKKNRKNEKNKKKCKKIQKKSKKNPPFFQSQIWARRGGVMRVELKPPEVALCL